MYEEFFGLNEKPFSIQPDPSFLYWGRSHRLAYAMLEYGVLNHAGISVITGEVGCGKTTLIHRLLDQLSDTHTVALLSNIQAGRGDLLSWVLMGFGQAFAGKTHVELFAELQTFFIGEYAKGRRVVLIIDEAQNLSVDMLEELRMLSNINAGKDQLLQLILVGQPELKNLLNRPDMLQLAQRVGSDFHLTPLSREEVDAYLDTRLSIAGASKRIFDHDAVDLVADESRGVPRVINIIADTALVYAFSANEPIISAQTVQSVIRDKSNYGVFGVAMDENIQIGESQPNDSPTLGPEESGALNGKGKSRPEKARKKKKAAVKKQPVVDSGHMQPVPNTQSQPTVETPSTLLEAAARIESGRQLEAGLSNGQEHVESVVETPNLIERAVVDPAPEFSALKVDIPETKLEKLEPAIVNDPVSSTGPPSARIGVVIIDDGGEISPEMAINSVGAECQIIFVTTDRDSEATSTALKMGADVVTAATVPFNPGRVRNTGYRRLKALDPAVEYVQFLESDFALDADWFNEAASFMARRPEVAIIDGSKQERFRENSLLNLVSEISQQESEGELQSAGATAFMRADSFEAAGGFRGDIETNDTEDLCLRMRRRGHHVWRISSEMGVSNSPKLKLKDWWREARRNGYEYAHGVFLHGAPPERFRVLEQARAIIWGGAFPLFIVLSAIVSAVGVKVLSPLTNPVVILLTILGFGFMVYFAKILLIAIRHGITSKSSWAYGVLATMGHLAEFQGVAKYYLTPRSKKPNRPPKA